MINLKCKYYIGFEEKTENGRNLRYFLPYRDVYLEENILSNEEK